MLIVYPICCVAPVRLFMITIRLNKVVLKSILITQCNVIQNLYWLIELLLRLATSNKKN